MKSFEIDDSKNKSEEFPYEISLAMDNDVEDIIKLQQENTKKELSAEEERREGFVSMEASDDLLYKIIKKEEVIIARDNGRVIAYFIPLTLERAKEIPFYTPLLREIPSIQYRRRTLNEYHYFILGQVCIKKEFRGQGILEKLYKK